MANYVKTPAMICDDLQCFQKLKIKGKLSISSQRVAGPLALAIVCPALTVISINSIL